MKYVKGRRSYSMTINNNTTKNILQILQKIYYKYDILYKISFAYLYIYHIVYDILVKLYIIYRMYTILFNIVL